MTKSGWGLELFLPAQLFTASTRTPIGGLASLTRFPTEYAPINSWESDANSRSARTLASGPPSS